MSCSVNLVPVLRMQAYARVRRRSAWVGACAATLVLFVAGWSVQRVAAGALARLSQEVGVLQIQRTDVQRRLMAATARRAQLLEQLQTVAAARRPQPWARRLVTLTRVVPEGVSLTALDVSTPLVGQVSAPAADDRSGDRSPSRLQVVHVRGHAVNHDALVELLNALQGLPDWPHVELVRANSEPHRGGNAVAFELDCRTVEDRP